MVVTLYFLPGSHFSLLYICSMPVRSNSFLTGFPHLTYLSLCLHGGKKRSAFAQDKRRTDILFARDKFFVPWSLSTSIHLHKVFQRENGKAAAAARPATKSFYDPSLQNPRILSTVWPQNFPSRKRTQKQRE